MCGRYTQHHSTDQIVMRFSVDTVVKEAVERYNAAPTQHMPVILKDSGTGMRSLDAFQWGLIPSWAKDASIGSKLVNARGETAGTKPSFRSALARRRCLVPADGYYEWTLEGKIKQPIYYRRSDKQLFAFAGIWETWNQPDGSPLHSFSILTTAPNELAARAHDRMPVILRPDTEDRWLDAQRLADNEIEEFLQPFPAEQMACYPVSTTVNRAGHEGPALITPITPQATSLFEDMD